GGDELDVEPPSLADQADPNRAADRVADHEPVHLVDAVDARLVHRDDEVLRAEPGARGGTVLDYLDDLDAARLTEAAREPRWQRARAAGNPEISAAESPFRHQRGDDAARRGVDRDGEAEADAGNGGVDPDDAAVSVCERAACVPGSQFGIRLEHV